MNFKDLDFNMRNFEKTEETIIPEDFYIVVRLDGKGFSKFTKKFFTKPFDSTFRDIMVDTVKHIMTNSGFRIVYGYTQSDEMSFVLHLNDNTYGRRVEKICSILASEASAYFSTVISEALQERQIVKFDCKVRWYPNINKVLDYFIWRQEDGTRNTLNGYCYWTLLNQNISARKVTSFLKSKNTSFKNDLLFDHGINFNNVPIWQKRGIGFYFEEIVRPGYNPIKNIMVETTRRTLCTNYDLPYNMEYKMFIKNIIEQSEM